MKRLLVCLMFCAGVSPAVAQWRCDSDGGVKYSSERVVDLPQDQERWYCTVMGHPNSPQFREVMRWFETNPELLQIRRGTHFSVMPSTSTMFRERYDATAGDLPCVRLQDARGNVLFQVSGRNVPLSAEALANSIRTTCLRRRNVQPSPQPSPYNLHLHYTVPDDEQEKKEQEQEDVFIRKDGSLIDIPLWVFVVLGVVAACIGVGVEWRNTYRKR